MKKVHLVMYSVLLIVGSACSQAQNPASTKTQPAATPRQDAAVGGAGIADYLPLWTSPTALGNSIVFQSGADIGIGTTTPGSTLDVDGAINAAGGYKLGGYSFVNGSEPKGNIFLGYGVGNSTMTGQSNTALGNFTLRYNTTGNWNTAIGAEALDLNTTGSGNTASGIEALVHNTAGSANTAAGVQALYSNTKGINNSANGSGALYLNTEGNNNTASGFNALVHNTTGSNNTATGFGALYSNVTGSNNTAMGYGAGTYNPDLTYATAIGAGAIVSQSNALVLGGPLGSGANVKVGIGTATPTNVFTIAQGGGEAIADGWATYSSRRWKTNIETLHGALAKVEQLRGVSYDLQATGRHEVGVIAEEVGAVVPEVVTWDQNGRDARSVDYSRLTALLIEATKEQQLLIEQQQEQIAQLMSQVKTIQVSLKTSSRGASEVRTMEANLRKVR
jgi:hypothetical protein